MLAYPNPLHRTAPRRSEAAAFLTFLTCQAVAAIAHEHDADAKQTIAALLHDAVDDERGLDHLAAIRGRCGNLAEKTRNTSAIAADLPAARQAAEMDELAQHG